MQSITNSTVAPQSLPAMKTHHEAGPKGSDFKNVLLQSINDVNSMQQQADLAVETLMTGGDADPAAVLTAVQKADLGFRMMMQMRNKMMQVYQEIKDIRI